MKKPSSSSSTSRRSSPCRIWPCRCHFVINSKVAKEHATDDDPWATEYLHTTPAGSGAYKVARWDSGQQIVYERFDEWVGGPLPKVRRIIIREVPSPANPARADRAW